jgi:hypothetical protein
MMECLRTAGYRIIYKAHPDHAKDVCAMLADYADAIDGGRFEDVYRQADCLLFAHCNTTTFGFALLTGKPMVLLQVKSDPWYPRFRQLVQKRCCFVEATIDEAGRITFDKQKLAAAIAASPERVDFDVVRECVFTDSAA